MIAVIDYKAGNLDQRGEGAEVSWARRCRGDAGSGGGAAADKIVLPGVGHFQATQLLQDLGLTEAMREAVAKGACRFWGFVWAAVAV